MGSKTNKKLEHKQQLLTKVKALATRGITSPTVVMEEIPEIKTWITAQKYINLAKQELSQQFELEQLETEYYNMINTLLYLRSKLLQQFNKNTNLNQLIGLSRQIVSVNKQLLDLLPLSKWAYDTYINKSREEMKKLKDEIASLFDKIYNV